MAGYLLDAGTCVAILRRDEGTLKKLTATAVGNVYVSAITQSELLFGVGMSRRERQDQEALDLFLRYAGVLEYPSGAAAHYGEIRMGMELRGETVGAHDLLLAAQARHLGLTLVTDKARRLGRTPGLEVARWGA
jgi:tRNA(fMet)-specific endonuclease VapC